MPQCHRIQAVGAMLATALLLLPMTLHPTPATGAVLETEITPEMLEIGCTMRLSGVIAEGDLDQVSRHFFAQRDQFQQIFEQVGYDFAELAERFPPSASRNYFPGDQYGETPAWSQRLCLDSPGGSILEALKIAEFIRRQSLADASGLPTGIARGDRCESACAWIFYSGAWRRFYSYGFQWYDQTSQNTILSPGGRLGVHMPFFPMPLDAELTATEALELQHGLSQAISQIVSAIHEDWLAMPLALLVEVLSTRSDEMRYINTVSDAIEANVFFVLPRYREYLAGIIHRGLFTAAE